MVQSQANAAKDYRKAGLKSIRETYTEAEFVNLLWSLEIDSHPGGPVRTTLFDVRDHKVT